MDPAPGEQSNCTRAALQGLPDLPTPHAVQAEAPVKKAEDTYVPGWHRVQSVYAVAPPFIAYVPGGQGVHLEEVVPVHAVYAPGGHRMQLLLPGSTEYAPTGHGVQAPAADRVAYVPIWHRVHAEAAA